MIFTIPQFIDIEDKIVGPLTAKQLGWVVAGAVILVISYNLFDTITFLFSAAIVAMIVGALAFYRPYNQPLIKFIASSVFFITRPKMYIWRREIEKAEIAKAIKNQKIITPTITKKKFDIKKANTISSILDTQK